MRLLIGLLALVPVAALVGGLLRTRIQARVRARRKREEHIEHLLEERQDIEEERTVQNLQRELDAARAREAKKQS